MLTADAERIVTPHTFEALARRESPRELYPHLLEEQLCSWMAPLVGKHHGQARARHRRQRPHPDGARLSRTRPRRAGDEPAHVGDPATQANAALLTERGVELIGPEEGELAEGERHRRMTEPEDIFARCQVLLCRRALQGRRVLVSAGGTREPLDAVRFLGNRSSGRMGVALAEEARRRGAEVTLLAANLAVRPPGGIEVVPTPTAADMAAAADARRDFDVVVMAAAVADYRPAIPQCRQAAQGRRRLDGAARADAGHSPRARRGPRTARCSSASRRTSASRASPRTEKLERKRADLIVFNDVAQHGIGFDTADNQVVLVSRDGERTVARARRGIGRGGGGSTRSKSFCRSAARLGSRVVSVVRLRLSPVGETIFPPREAPFFQRPSSWGNLPVPLGTLPRSQSNASWTVEPSCGPDRPLGARGRQRLRADRDRAHARPPAYRHRPLRARRPGRPRRLPDAVRHRRTSSGDARPRRAPDASCLGSWPRC